MTQTYSLPSVPFALRNSEEWAWRTVPNGVEVEREHSAG